MGFLRRIIGFAVKVTLAMVLLVILVAVLTPRSKPTVAPPATIAAETAVSLPVIEEPADALPIGTEVEVAGNILYDDIGPFHEAQRTGNRPRGLTNGKDILGVESGTMAVVEANQPGAVRVKMVEKNWNGRSGWIPRDQARVKLTDSDLAGDTVDGLSLGRRREIFQALNASGSGASRIAEERFPMGKLGEMEEPQKQIDAHRKVYESEVKRGRVALVKKYKVDGATLDRIDAEGMAKKWPVFP